MNMKFGEWWRAQDTIDRGTYALVGVLGFAIKHNLDRLVATYGFHRPWGFFNYWVPVRDVARITEVRGSEAVFLGTMVALSLPFIWVGVVLTMKRLRSAGLPIYLVALFFLPFLNLLFFLMLCLLPERRVSPGTTVEGFILRSNRSGERRGERRGLSADYGAGWIGNRDARGAGTAELRLGIVRRALLHHGIRGGADLGNSAARSLGGGVWVACLSVLLLGGALLALAFEGIICLMMAIPIALPLAVLGGLRIPSAEATTVSKPCSRIAVGVARFRSWCRNRGTHGGYAVPYVCGANGD